jgi:hypothetical protein
LAVGPFELQPLEDLPMRPLCLTILTQPATPDPYYRGFNPLLVGRTVFNGGPGDHKPVHLAEITLPSQVSRILLLIVVVLCLNLLTHLIIDRLSQERLGKQTGSFPTTSSIVCMSIKRIHRSPAQACLALRRDGTASCTHGIDCYPRPSPAADSTRPATSLWDDDRGVEGFEGLRAWL